MKSWPDGKAQNDNGEGWPQKLAHIQSPCTTENRVIICHQASCRQGHAGEDVSPPAVCAMIMRHLTKMPGKSNEKTAQPGVVWAERPRRLYLSKLDEEPGLATRSL